MSSADRTRVPKMPSMLCRRTAGQQTDDPIAPGRDVRGSKGAVPFDGSYAATRGGFSQGALTWVVSFRQPSSSGETKRG